MLKVGVIGYGSRISDIIDLVLGFELGVEVVAFTDINEEKARKNFEKSPVNKEKIRFYASADEMLAAEELDGCLIGTRCSTHAGYAIKVLEKGIPLFLEKPVCTSMEDLLKLKEAGEATAAEVVVSFPLKTSNLVEQVKKLVDAGEIGEVQHVQAYNNVPYGGVYFHSWYRDEGVTGGLFLQKSTHDFDYINYVLGKTPVKVCAVESKQIFKGDKSADLYCKDCPEREACPESDFTMRKIKFDSPHGSRCCFSVATGNHDNASAILLYENGMHVSYSQNFFARKAAQLRGARFIGYKGTIEFDWYKGVLNLYKHGEAFNATYNFDTSSSTHFGGDHILALNFIRVMQKKEKSISPLEEGINSALVCLKVKQSAQTQAFVDINWENCHP